eukprot:TRINITY_DN64583_c0_g1_i1.p1 TRINITY_DN64583_c0_g1~~TRINITY_DN64583_c0_g1_i1.p1  ORF type:complete len:674 (-),score=115.42 TRINITY_DN64583_c0_g1_i1:28-2025(-)
MAPSCGSTLHKTPEADAGKARHCCAKLSDELFKPRGPSGHSLFKKLRFAISLSSPFGMMAVVGIAKDIYLEKFGLDPTILGCLVTVMSFWAPFQEILMGRLQDKQVLAGCFPVAKWGRRAPWTLTHGIIAAVVASVIYLPPQGPMAYAWFVATTLGALWGCSGQLISFEASRQAIYPFKEERMFVEGLCKYSCMAGGGAGGLVFLLLSSNAAWEVRMALLFYILPLGLVSLEAVPIFREASKPIAAKSSPEEGDPNIGFGSLTILWEALPKGLRLRLLRGRGDSKKEKATNRALQHLLALKFWQGTYASCVSSMLLYFVTYDLGLSGRDRALVIAGAGAAAGITETVMNIAFMKMFTTTDSLNDKSGRIDKMLVNIVVVSRILNAGMTVLLIGFTTPTVPILFVWSIISRIFLCSFSFWRISAQCWLVDEDCLGSSSEQREQTEFREGMIFGALSMSSVLAGAICLSATFLGLGLAGLETRNCEQVCTDFPSMNQTFSRKTGCIDACFREVIDGQPESLRLYIRAVMGFFAPCCELLVAYHAHSFPIRGVRLRRLYLRIAQQRGDAVEEKLAAAPRDAYSGASQIVLGTEAGIGGMSEGAANLMPFSEFAVQLAHATAIVNARKGSVSVSVRGHVALGHEERDEASTLAGEQPGESEIQSGTFSL